jgi:hypothetical protein
MTAPHFITAKKGFPETAFCTVHVTAASPSDSVSGDAVNVLYC